ncbi:ABC transporter substrate-binding protein [Saccharomonospora xinjiangensis]|uniref:ABC-type branched-chain amino acid transport system, periplasmic component n=1 Tax=Saccharomonospora xinjiangensis XJ-54 TaxID=882086 RepID=I0V5Q4_9PSEU|nr:ABC transporter substrate-binding protein [Saccharomonospora xinjiangensis]EID55457.1 ABC-type branched-chain amino acid transport system, periplasmic component [Saccharomonospora xinjiangensis XJ-54]
MGASAGRRSAVLMGAVALLLAGCVGGDEEPRGGSDGGDGVFRLGYVLPETGQLASQGPAQIESVRLAVKEINDAGGVLGQPIPEVTASDEGGNAGVAARSADRVLASGVDAVIGAAASDMSLAIIDTVTGSGVVQCSGSNTAATFTDYPDNGLYFRTAPSDALQATVLSKVIVADGEQRVAVVARGDDYGRGLLKSITKELKDTGIPVVLGETYEPGSEDFDRVARKVREVNPDAAVVVAFDEGAAVLRAMIEAGVGPRDINVYGTDGLRGARLASEVSPDDPGVLAGLKGTAPATGNGEYTARLRAFAPEVRESQFAPQVFDCVTIVALAVEATQSDDPIVFATAINEVTANGERCTSFADCKRLLDRGTNIDYDGESGPLDFVEEGEPGRALFDVYTYDASGALRTVRTEEGSATN